MIYLKPVEGRVVSDPERGGLLAAAGRRVEPTQYWLRRLGDEDVEEAEPPPEPEQPETPPVTAADQAAVAVSEPMPRKPRRAEESQS